jgi:DNA-binding MarR family transcriptional regulator
MCDELAEATAMARTVKRARSALIEAVRVALHSDGGSALRTAHLQVFECLDLDGTRLTTLAERAQMSHQAMGELVTELVGAGLLERVPDPDDRRARVIRTTTRGRAELTRAAAHLHRLRQRWEDELDSLTVDEVITALDTLIRICRQADPE